MSNCSFWKNYFILVNLLVGIYSSDHSNLNLGCELSMRFLLKLNLGNPLSANFKKWLNTLKQFVGNLATNCLSVFGHVVGLAFNELIVNGYSLTIFTKSSYPVDTRRRFNVYTTSYRRRLIVVEMTSCVY